MSKPRLVPTPDGLGLVDDDEPKLSPLVLDFVGGRVAWRKRTGASSGDLLVRALGKRTGVKSVVDASAGLGRDACALAAAGFDVVAVERAPLMAALWRDALARSGHIERLRFVESDAADVLHAGNAPDAVYFDPMYDAGPRKAAQSAELRLVRVAVGDVVDDAASLLALARRVAQKRVVVKRPKKAPPIASDVDVAFVGTSTRFDVYLRKPGR